MRCRRPTCGRRAAHVDAAIRSGGVRIHAVQLHVGGADRERGHADRAVVAAGRPGDRREGDLSGRAAGLSARDRLRAVTAGPHAHDVAALGRAVRRLERAARLRIGVVAALGRTRAVATVRVDPQVRARRRRGRWRGLLADEDRAHALRGSQPDHARTPDHLARPGPPTEPPTRLRLSLQPDARSVGDPRLARGRARNAFGRADDGAMSDHDHRQRDRPGRSKRCRTASGGEQAHQDQGSDPPADRRAIGPSPQGEKTTPMSSAPRCLGADYYFFFGFAHVGSLGAPP